MKILIYDRGCWWLFGTDMTLFQYHTPSAAAKGQGTRATASGNRGHGSAVGSQATDSRHPDRRCHPL
jgi:hypothetical protein